MRLNATSTPHMPSTTDHLLLVPKHSRLHAPVSHSIAMTATVVVAVATLCLVLGAAGSAERSTATAAESANRFGMGVYTDTPGSPPYAAQLPLAKTLVGERGWTLFFANLLFDQPGNSSSLKPSDPSVAAALHQAYAMNLR